MAEDSCNPKQGPTNYAPAWFTGILEMFLFIYVIIVSVDQMIGTTLSNCIMGTLVLPYGIPSQHGTKFFCGLTRKWGHTLFGFFAFSATIILFNQFVNNMKFYNAPHGATKPADCEVSCRGKAANSPFGAVPIVFLCFALLGALMKFYLVYFKNKGDLSTKVAQAVGEHQDVGFLGQGGEIHSRLAGLHAAAGGGMDMDMDGVE